MKNELNTMETEKALVSTLVKKDLDYEKSETIVKKYTIDIDDFVFTPIKGKVTYSPNGDRIEITILLYFKRFLQEDLKAFIDEVNKKSDDICYLHTIENMAVSHNYSVCLCWRKQNTAVCFSRILHSRNERKR